MIKYIISDIGGVIMNVKVMDLLRKYKPNLAEIKAIVTVMADSEEWDRWNKGLYRDVYEMTDGLKLKYPKYAGMMEKAFTDDWSLYMKPDTGMLKGMKEMHDKGMHILFLADIPHELYDVFQKSEFAELAEGGVYSFREHTRKPDQKMYDALIERYHLDPKECVMIDDNRNYLKPAAAAGMHVIHFQNAKQTMMQLGRLLEEA